MRRFGKYRLVEPLATGGMAEVWRAEVTGAEGVVKEVALKLVRGEYEADSEFVRMFIQEARLAARLGHANVVQVFEFDQVDGRYYIAMELVRGRHLGRVVDRARERGVRIGVPRAVQIGVEVARALGYAHRLADGVRPVGLVHRDVSPHNVLVSFEGEVKLADFGIARAMNLAEATEPGTVKGKAAYMAPEQARGAPVDARADVFALGVVLWELCAGRRLFARDSEAAALAAVLGPEPVSPPSAWNEEIPSELDAAILAALEKDPERRTRSAQDLATALSGIFLRIARTPEDVDLRALMQRLFPDEAAPRPAAEETRVRPVPVAAEPVAEVTRRSPPPEEAATRTAPASRTRSRRVRTLALAAALSALAAAAALGVVRMGLAGTERGSDRSASGGRSAPEPDPPPASPPPGGVSPAADKMPGAPPLALETASSGEPEPPATPARPPAYAPGARSLAVPPAASGEGILFVNSIPWGSASVDGFDVGYTPVSVRLRAGVHHVVVKGRNGSSADAYERVRAGKLLNRTLQLAPR